MNDLQTYLPRIAAVHTIGPLAPAQHEEPAVAALSEVEGAITMADLLAAHRSTANLARNRLEELSGRSPGNPQAEELLAYLAAQDSQPGAPR